MEVSPSVIHRSRQAMQSLFGDLAESLRQPEFWAYSSWLDIVTRYRKLYLGMLWVLIPPVVYIFGLGYMYKTISGRSENFISHLGMGWALWRFTTMVINESTSVFSSYKAFIMDGRTCLTDFLLRTLSKAMFYLFFSLIVVVLVLLRDPSVHASAMLTMVLTLPVYLLNLMWLSVVIALLGARYPDVREFVSTFLMFGFFFTPILWSAQTLPANSPRGLIARFNPAFHFIEFVRAPVLGQPIEHASLVVVALMSVGGWLIASVLYRRYARFVPLWA
ncbi:ABC transporter permease [Dyella sp.]|jgi:ABC-type polysaccharide/polyol phosphate export permease|uniref:ABC transporter permease n=1 Tax=Dyella sp. TaxID=1869338 RepID=UPI002D7A34C5|nr:ABC transporter permease [Dyella sp.]HET6430824.1 ABC transporter permease [Dyella sp.]